MISVEDLRKWADEHAICRSPSYPRGWVSASDLLVLARLAEDHAIGRCYGCSDCHIVSANGGWSFFGCYHEPYHGKWITEIKNCPKEGAKTGFCRGKHCGKGRIYRTQKCIAYQPKEEGE